MHARDPTFEISHVRLARRLGKFRERLPPFDEWIRNAAGFFAQDNLETVVAETRVPALVRGRNLVVPDRDTEIVITDAGWTRQPRA